MAESTATSTQTQASVTSAPSEFKIGDVVRLKSGSPRMTVVSTELGKAGANQAGPIKCWWFSKPTEKSEAGFPPEALEHATPPKSPVAQAFGRLFGL